MYLSGMTLNVISMGGITIGIGMLVDNSVVVMDNIFKYWDKGYSAKESAMIGAKEIFINRNHNSLFSINQRIG